MKNVEGILRDFPDHCQPPEAPDGHSLYRRVLVPATGESAGEVVWVYTIEATHLKGRRIESGRWPEAAG